MLRQMLRYREDPEYFPVDVRGELIWDKVKNSKFCVLVIKRRGLQEFGPAEDNSCPHGNILPTFVSLSQFHRLQNIWCAWSRHPLVSKQDRHSLIILHNSNARTL